METPELTKELKQALDAHHGCLQGDGYIIMSSAVFRNTMGVAAEADLAESLQAIARGHADVEAGRTRPFRDVLAELGSDDQIHG